MTIARESDHSTRHKAVRSIWDERSTPAVMMSNGTRGKLVLGSELWGGRTSTAIANRRREGQNNWPKAFGD